MQEEQKRIQEEEQERIRLLQEQEAIDKADPQYNDEKIKAIPLDVIYKKNMTKIMNEYSQKMSNTTMMGGKNLSSPSIRLQTTIRTNTQDTNKPQGSPEQIKP
mmetsp:Transcript_7268/g.6407  ORF Transcript_7268/g.6407 Transcript_7268/m.6407 type:complete len:103 (+) Transcript_7268:1257-1565(+)